MRKSLVVMLVMCILVVIGLEVADRVIRQRLADQRQCPVPAAVVREPVKPERIGERIEYDIKLGMLKLGTSLFRQVENGVVGEAKANVFIFETKLIRFSDTEKIFADPRRYLPLRVERNISAWPKHEEIVEEYDQKAYKVTLNKGGRHDEIKSDGPLQNAILLPFSLRECARMEPGWRAQVNLPTQQFAIVFMGTEKISVPAGDFDTYHFKSEPEKFEVWVTADESKIPVKIKGTGAIGYTMFMSKYTPPDSARAGTRKD